MRLHKSAKARDVLMSQNLALSQAERRILILCDGQRTRDLIENMLGDAASSTIDVLIAQGYLQASSASVNAANAGADSAFNTLSRLSKKLLNDKASPPAQKSSPTRDNDQTIPVSTQADDASKHSSARVQGESRRSLAACKMYMLDMLQLQRSVESSALAVDIQTASNEEQLADHLIQALGHLSASTKSSIGKRIAERLQETMPDTHLHRLQSAISDLFDQTSAQASTSLNVVAIRRDVA